MERVAFLIEETNERLGCLLNPAGLVMRRKAGVRARRSATGHLTGTGLTDDPMLFTGGGRTELELDLLFDVQLEGSSITSTDVRELTRPLWNLAENASGAQSGLSLVRFVWGKSWNVLGAVVAVAERLEHFTQVGVPQRSWLRLLFLRLDQPPPEPAAVAPPPSTFSEEELARLAEGGGIHELVGGIPPGAPTSQGAAEGVATAEDVVAAALAESGAEAALAAAQQRITGAAEAAMQGISAFLSRPAATEEAAPSEEEEAAPSDEAAEPREAEPSDEAPSLEEAAEGVLAAFGGMVAAIEVFASVAKTEVFEAVATATEEIVSASQAAAQYLDRLADGAGEAVVAGCRDALREIGDGIDAMHSAAGDAAAAVKARASALIATAAEDLEAFAEGVEEELASVAAWTSEVGREVVEGIQAALGPMRAVAADVRATGQAVLESISPALGAIGAEVERLWSAGEHAAAEGVAAAVEAAAFALKKAREASEAMALATHARAARAITASVADVRATLQEDPDVEAASTNEAVEAALVTMEVRMAAVTTPAAAAALAPASDAVQDVRAALGTSSPALLKREDVPAAPTEADVPERAAAPEVPEEAEAAEASSQEKAERIVKALDVIEAAVAAMEQAEQAEVAEWVQAAAVEARPSAPTVLAEPASVVELDVEGEPAPRRRPAEAAAETSIGFGERLEHVAYRYYRDPALWRLLAAFNGLDDPLHPDAGSNLRIPPLYGGSRP